MRRIDLSAIELTSESAAAAIGTIREPEIGGDLATLGILKDVRVRDASAVVSLEMPVPLFPRHDALRDAVSEKLRALGAGKIEFNMTSLIRGRRAADKGELLPGVKNVVAVASGKGGVGKSTLSVNLALTFSRCGASVGLLDADVYGPSMGMMLGVDERPKPVAEDRILPVNAHDLKLMSMAFLSTEDAPVIWRGPMVHGLVQQFLANVEWGELDYLVIDLPPGTGDAQLTLTQSAPLAGAVIVSTPQDVSLIDARKGLRMFQQVNVPVLGMVENMSYFACPHCNTRTEIFRHGGGRKASEEMGIPFLGEVPIDPEVVLGGDNGTPIVSKNPDSPAARAYEDVAWKTACALARLAAETTEGDSFFIEWEETK